MFKILLLVILAGCHTANVYRTHYTERYINIDNVKIRYLDEGDGQVIVLIHGHMSRLEEFDSIFPMLINDYRVIAIDLPGFGYSARPDIKYSLIYYEYIISSVLNKLNINDVIVAGGSMGGNLALRMGRHYPSLVKKVIAWSPAGVWEPHDLMAWGATFMDGILFYPIVWVQSRYWYSDNFEYRDEFTESALDWVMEASDDGFKKASADVAADQLRQTHIGLGWLNKQPTLIIVGDNDNGLDLWRNAVKFAFELPDGEIIILNNTGHSLMIERPDKFLEFFLEFLGR